MLEPYPTSSNCTFVCEIGAELPNSKVTAVGAVLPCPVLMLIVRKGVLLYKKSIVGAVLCYADMLYLSCLGAVRICGTLQYSMN